MNEESPTRPYPHKLSRLLSDYLILTKVRLSSLVLASTAAGYVLASGGVVNLWHLLATLASAFGVIGGANALNQVLERDSDAKMRRTQNRPLPAGRLSLEEAMLVGTALSISGLLGLMLATNMLTTFLAAFALAVYVFAYTPLKRKTSLCTLVGAVSGAIPPVMGWTAVRGELSVEAWALFALQFVWQFPHLWAIAWLYRDDYARAGYVMLPVQDLSGWSTGRQVVLYCLTLLPVSLLPAVLGLAGMLYFTGAMLLGIMLLGCGLWLLATRSMPSARRLMMATMVYLPVLLMMMTLDRM